MNSRAMVLAALLSLGSPSVSVAAPPADELVFVDAWVEGERIILLDEQGRLFSIALDTLGQDSRPQAGAASVPNVPSVSAPSVEDLIELLAAGVSEQTIRAQIRALGASYDLSTAEIIRLKQAGASEELLQFLIESARGGTAFRSGYTRRPRRGQEVPRATRRGVDDVLVSSGGIPWFPFVSSGFGGFGGLHFRSGHRHSKHPDDHHHRAEAPRTVRRATRSILPQADNTSNAEASRAPARSGAAAPAPSRPGGSQMRTTGSRSSSVGRFIPARRGTRSLVKKR